MRLAARYSFKRGFEEVSARHPDLLAEVLEAVRAVDAAEARTKVSSEKSMPGQLLYSPAALNAAFKRQLYPRGWKNLIDCGVEVVPVKSLALEMSSGVSYFEQFVWDLTQRGVADIDIPVLILGIAP